MKNAAGLGPQKPARREPRAHPENRRIKQNERSLLVMEPPIIKGPYPVAGNPGMAEYKIVAQLSLPAPDTEVVPSIEVHATSGEGECIDVRWTTNDSRAPRGIWERSAVVTIPRQFAIAGYAVTGDTPLLEREAGV